MEILPYVGQYDVSGFSCGDEPQHVELNDFLKNDAARYAATAIGQTYVAVRDDFVLGYTTLLVDAIWLNPEEKGSFAKADVPSSMTVPALKVGRLARATSSKTPLVGRSLMRFAFYTLLDISESAGCRLLSVDAIPSAVPFYEKLGFVRNLHFNHAGKKRGTISMRFDAFSPARPDWTRHLPLMRPAQPADPHKGELAQHRRSGAA